MDIKKKLATGAIGLLALGGAGAALAPQALAHGSNGDRTGFVELTEEEREARMAEREAARADKLAAIADAAGVSTDAITAGREAGQSLADIITANGGDVQAVIDLLVERAETRLDEAVAEGRLDEAVAAEKAEGIVERVTERVNSEPGEGGKRGGRGGHRGHRGGATEGASV